MIIAEKKPGESTEKTGRDNTETVPETADDDVVAGEGEKLLCTQCKATVTTVAEQVEVNGRAHHSFANPHGLYFEITCYGNAPGCMYSADASGEFTWFRGFRWKVAACSTCTAHLGWLFIASTTRFHGLISERLVLSRPAGIGKE